jgi:hypothetical protein
MNDTLDPSVQAMIAAAACTMLVIGVAGIVACFWQLTQDEED